MKVLVTLTAFLFLFSAAASVPTEEGLLKNLNNAGIPGNLITIKTMIHGSALGAISESDAVKADYYKLIISLENPNAISLLQVQYSNSQMLASQIKDVKYIPDLITSIRREKSPDKGLFYSVLLMIAANKPQGLIVFLEKNGIQIVKNRNILNEEKMKLLKSYRAYLANTKGKGEANSPLNPPDPQSKAKVIELFRANTFARSKNIELVKLENEFVWKVDWKSLQAYFTKEDRRLRKIDYINNDISSHMDATDYVLFNGTNELPKFITFKDTKNLTAKIQILSLDTKSNREKKLSERYEDAKKMIPSAPAEAYSFLY
jgi:hypothetical protein